MSEASALWNFVYRNFTVKSVKTDEQRFWAHLSRTWQLENVWRLIWNRIKEQLCDTWRKCTFADRGIPANIHISMISGIWGSFTHTPIVRQRVREKERAKRKNATAAESSVWVCRPWIVGDGSNRDQLVCKSHVNIASSPGICFVSLLFYAAPPPCRQKKSKPRTKRNSNEIETKLLPSNWTTLFLLVRMVYFSAEYYIIVSGYRVVQKYREQGVKVIEWIYCKEMLNWNFNINVFFIEKVIFPIVKLNLR